MAPVQGADQAIRPSCIAQGASGVRGRGWSSLAPEPGFVVGPSCRLIIGARTGLGCCDPVRWTVRPAPGPPAPMFFASSLPRGFEIGPGTFATPVEVTTCIPIRAAACGDTPFALAPGTTPRDCTTLRLCPQRFELSSFVVLLLLAHHWARCCATWRVSVADTARTRAASIAQRRVGASQRSGSGRGCNGVRTRKGARSHRPDLQAGVGPQARPQARCAIGQPSVHRCSAAMSRSDQPSLVAPLGPIASGSHQHVSISTCALMS